MKAVWRECFAEPDVVFDRLGGSCRFDEAEVVLHERTHGVFDLTPKRWLRVNHLVCSCVSHKPSTPDDNQLTI
jgi:hypothetical protein